MPEGSSQEKTEDATPRRLREARKKGQVPKSRDVNMIFVMIFVFIVLAFSFGFMGGEFKKFFQLCFDSVAKPEIDGATLWDLGKAGLLTFAKALGPLFVAGVFVAFLVGLIQVGPVFSGEPLKFKPERLNPVEGLKNMFKVVTFIELIKNIAKIAVVFYLAYSTIYKRLEEILLSSRIDVLLSAQLTGGIIFEFIVKVCIAFVILAIIDYAVQRWNFMKNMRMTKEEVKREYKQDEGDPAIKGERRRLHREMAFGDLRKAVKKADVVVTNPVHVAAVVEYNKEEMGAPTLTAKGQRAFAQMIVDMANEEGVSIVRNIPLAWSLVHLEIGDEVPEALYEAVAEVLTMVYEMKGPGAPAREPGVTSKAPGAPTGGSKPSVYA
ncbi:MAG: EscU/YscU/HrcU family type III secretion system export apparatus switch protein [Deltaproteobacteria bacterium]|nr:EscU/YscU/HrcU family type III secretion system export apparatus switch protein [Deltaproteobacteria bacterium]